MADEGGPPAQRSAATWTISGLEALAVLKHPYRAPAGTHLQLVLSLTPKKTPSLPSWTAVFASLRVTAAVHDQTIVRADANFNDDHVTYEFTLKIPGISQTLSKHAVQSIEMNFPIIVTASLPLLTHESGTNFSTTLERTFVHNQAQPPAQEPLILSSIVAAFTPLMMENIVSYEGSTPHETILSFMITNRSEEHSVTIHGILASFVFDCDVEEEVLSLNDQNSVAQYPLHDLQIIHKELPILLSPGCAHALACIVRRRGSHSAGSSTCRYIQVDARWSTAMSTCSREKKDASNREEKDFTLQKSMQEASFLLLCPNTEDDEKKMDAIVHALLLPPRCRVSLCQTFCIKCELLYLREAPVDDVLLLKVGAREEQSKAVRTLASLIRLSSRICERQFVQIPCISFAPGLQIIALDLVVVTGKDKRELPTFIEAKMRTFEVWVGTEI